MIEQSAAYRGASMDHGASLQVTSLIEQARHRAREMPDTGIFLNEAAPVTCASVLADAEALAAALRGIGLRPGDVISFQLPNWSETAVINLAASALGLICSPIVPIYRGAELPYMLNDSRSRMVFIPGVFRSTDFAAMYEGFRDRLDPQMLVVGVRAPGHAGPVLEDLIERGRGGPVALPPPDVDQDKLLLYTSGTTGRPKAVRHSQRTLAHAMENSVRRWGLRAGDVMLMPSPVTHATGFVNALELPFYHGTSALLMDRWDAAEAVELIDRFQVAATVGATPFLAELTAAAMQAGSTLPSLRVFACGGAAVPPEVIRQANAVMRQRPAFRVYGSSEAPYVTLGFSGSDDPERAAATDGQIVGYDVRLLDEAGHDVPPGENGEIAVRGPSLFLGYRTAEDTAAVMTADGYFLTGDVACVDRDGALTIRDRKKDIIIRGGENISAKEIEDALHRHPSIVEAAVVAMPHARMGEGVFAFLIAAPEAAQNPAGITRFLDELDLSKQKIPERYAFVEDFPRTPSGKIRKDVLRKAAAEECRAPEGE